MPNAATNAAASLGLSCRAVPSRCGQRGGSSATRGDTTRRTPIQTQTLTAIGTDTRTWDKATIT